MHDDIDGPSPEDFARWAEWATVDAAKASPGHAQTAAPARRGVTTSARTTAEPSAAFDPVANLHYPPKSVKKAAAAELRAEAGSEPKVAAGPENPPGNGPPAERVRRIRPNHDSRGRTMPREQRVNTGHGCR